MSTEDNLLQLFEENVCLTGEEIEEKIYKMSSHNNDIILSLSKDSVVINGEQIIFRRLHIKTRESGDYANVGWVMMNIKILLEIMIICCNCMYLHRFYAMILHSV
jgi:hypothetical protein